MAGDYDEARKLLEELRNTNEQDYWVYLSLIEAASGNSEAALNIFDSHVTDDLVHWRRNVLEYQRDYLKARV